MPTGCARRAARRRSSRTASSSSRSHEREPPRPRPGAAPRSRLPDREAADDARAVPLSLNALRLACNQTTSREPVLNLDEAQVRAAAQRLGQIGFARLASGPGSRTAKYRHLLDESLGLDRAETAVLAVLL